MGCVSKLPFGMVGRGVAVESGWEESYQQGVPVALVIC